MSRVLKVFCSPSEEESLAGSYPVIERYDRFVLIDVADNEIGSIARRFPVEGITGQYAVRMADGEVDTSRPRLDRKGKQLPHPAYKGKQRLSPGAHHFLVEFVGPIKEAWLEQVRKAGGALRTPFEGFTYVVRAKEPARKAVAALPFVRWMGHLSYEHRIAPSLRARLAGGEAPALLRTRVLPDSVSVEFFDARDMKAGLARLDSLQEAPLTPRRFGFDPAPGPSSARPHP